jgi:hypothetical protein
MLVLLPLIFAAVWGLNLYGGTFWPERGTRATGSPDTVADTTKTPELIAAPRAGVGISKKAASKEANKFPAPTTPKALAKTNPALKQPAAKAVPQDPTSEWVRQVFRN